MLSGHSFSAEANNNFDKFLLRHPLARQKVSNV